MKKRWFALAAVAALALVLASPGSSSAVIVFTPGGVGYGGWGLGGWGYGGLGYGGLYGGYRMPMMGYGSPGFMPGYGMTYGWGGAGAVSPYSYVGYGTTYAPAGYAYSPGYTGLVNYAGYGAMPTSWVTAPNTYVAFYPPAFPRTSPAAAPAPTGTPVAYQADEGNRAVVHVEVPANATLWFDGAKTRQTGALRTFTTPALERGRSYHYDVKARWEQDGKPVEKTRRVSVSPGARVTVDFNEPGK